MRFPRAALASLLPPLLLGGLLPLPAAREARWPTAGTWRMPVGEACVAPAADAERPAFRLLRGIQFRGDRHEGADLGNGREGDTVRAAANGLVVLAAGDGGSGYGQHVVLAHRLADERLVYSVYAHLLPGSVELAPGDVVSNGEVVGRVGRTGHASAPHLHFEVREVTDPADRWENERPIDPLAFVLARLGEARFDSTWARPYLEWAETAGLLPPGANGPEPITRADWWTMLAGAAVVPGAVPGRSLDVRDSLIAWSLLPEEAADDAPHATPGWNEITRDLKRLSESPRRLMALGLSEEEHRERCKQAFGERRPAERPRALAHRDTPPTLAEACVLLADLGPVARPARVAPERAAKLEGKHVARGKTKSAHGPSAKRKAHGQSPGTAARTAAHGGAAKRAKVAPPAKGGAHAKAAKHAKPANAAQAAKPRPSGKSASK